MDAVWIWASLTFASLALAEWLLLHYGGARRARLLTMSGIVALMAMFAASVYFTFADTHESNGTMPTAGPVAVSQSEAASIVGAEPSPTAGAEVGKAVEACANDSAAAFAAWHNAKCEWYASLTALWDSMLGFFAMRCAREANRPSAKRCPRTFPAVDLSTRRAAEPVRATDSDGDTGMANIMAAPHVRADIAIAPFLSDREYFDLGVRRLSSRIWLDEVAQCLDLGLRLGKIDPMGAKPLARDFGGGLDERLAEIARNTSSTVDDVIPFVPEIASSLCIVVRAEFSEMSAEGRPVVAIRVVGIGVGSLAAEWTDVLEISYAGASAVKVAERLAETIGRHCHIGGFSVSPLPSVGNRLGF